ncbi:LPXTG cell wall anchor domain-containing protein [Streptomyces sp. NPDC048171]|uniref:LPXTG cell wall anchor domain-containing protein n=1 Tax=unclassified Streptomyces TaxID=2593676 RepID=UPI0013698209|nr:LPXTG cell wall anchor domain-containing protein [Streptomyces sp. SID5789]MZE70355.1 LPXTG cell wall anchor domain-containing protein [Streptomyces sp. SID5789]
MKIRRVLATAVAAAVTAPVVLLSSAPAFADEKPAAQTQKAKPTIEELRQAVERAQKEYDAAVIAVKDAKKFLKEGLEEETYPTKAALIEAEKAAEDAAKVKAEADQAVVDAQAKLDAATTDEDKAAAQTELDEAKTAATEAAEAKTAADTAHTEAQDAHDDERVAQARKIELLKKARDEAKTKLDDAEKALSDAEAEEGDEGAEGEEPAGECVAAPELTAVVSGLPDKVVGGTTETFTLRVTNGTGGTLDEVYPFASAHGFDTKGYKELDSYLDLEWSTAANPKWRDADLLGGTSIGSLKANASVDVKLRLKVDEDVLAGEGSVYVTADYLNDDGSCGGYPDLDDYAFQILPEGGDNADDPGKPEDPKDKPAPNSPTGQGGTSTTPVNTSSTTTTGSLAQTGSNDALPKIALAGGAALVLGAGAVIVTRRRNKSTGA